MQKFLSIAILILVAMLSACSTNPAVKTNAIHEQSIGAVKITYNDDGDWIKLTSVGVSPVHNTSSHAISEASKIAEMYAQSNIALFMNNHVHVEKIVNTSSRSNSSARIEGEDGDMTVLSDVINHIRSNSSALLRGAQITDQKVTDNYVQVEITVTKQSVMVAQSVQNFMNGNMEK